MSFNLMPYMDTDTDFTKKDFMDQNRALEAVMMGLDIDDTLVKMPRIKKYEIRAENYKLWRIFTAHLVNDVLAIMDNDPMGLYDSKALYWMLGTDYKPVLPHLHSMIRHVLIYYALVEKRIKIAIDHGPQERYYQSFKGAITGA